MQPDAPTPDPDRYNFILDHPQRPKRQWLPTGGSKKQRVIMMGGLGAGLLLVLVIMFSLLSGSGGNQALLDIANQQQELIRVTELSRPKVRSTKALNLNANVALSINTAQQKTITQLSKQRVKVKSKQLGLKQNPKTDQELETASQNGRYDEQFLEIMVGQLTSYQAALQKQYQATNSASEKQLLRELFDQAGVLLKGQTAVPL